MLQIQLEFPINFQETCSLACLLLVSRAGPVFTQGGRAPGMAEGRGQDDEGGVCGGGVLWLGAHLEWDPAVGETAAQKQQVSIGHCFENLNDGAIG